MSALGYMYTQGIGVPKDEAQALKWYLQAADKGETSVYTLIGLGLLPGQRHAANGTEAIKWFSRTRETTATSRPSSWSATSTSWAAAGPRIRPRL